MYGLQISCSTFWTADPRHTCQTNTPCSSPFLLSVKTNSDSSIPGSVPPVISPELLQTTTHMMNMMSTEDLHKMFKMDSPLKERDPFSTEVMLNTNGPRSNTGSRLSQSGGTSTVNRDYFAGGSSPNGLLSNSISHTSPPPSLPTSTADLQDKMRDQMKDPAMGQNMSPDMKANMSKQFGVKISGADVEKVQQAMSSSSPDDLEKMMRWADRIQTGVESVKKTKN